MALILLAAACSSEPEPGATVAEDQAPATQPIIGAPGTDIRVPWHGADGNRVAAGVGAVTESEPVDVSIGGRITWLVGGVLDDGPVWVAVTEDGEVRMISVAASGEPTVSNLPRAPGVGPPALLVQEGSANPVFAVPGGAPPSAPGLSGQWALAVDEGGTVLIDGGTEFAVAALPDARFVFDGGGRALVLSGASDRYPHGVLGDPIEATTISLIDLDQGTVKQIVEIAEGEVIEGTSPIWADLDGDGAREVIVTVSTPSDGARIVAFDEAGAVVAESDPIGRGGRWRHQIAVAPLGPEGELELVDVLTPHIGGVVEFFRISGDRLEIVASLGGFTSHFIRSRNLSLAVVADADGDGSPEVVLAAQDRRSLAGIVHTGAGARVAWTAPLDGELSSNLSAVTLADGTLALAAGRSDGTVRIWMSS
jgi:hypothetical protein